MKDDDLFCFTAQEKNPSANPSPCSSILIKWIPQELAVLIELALEARVDYLFVGGSLVVSDHLDQVVRQIKDSL